MAGIPRPYSAAHDPLPDTSAKLRRGAALFERHCASCHGWNGQGGGPEAFALVPAPADLEWLARTPKTRSGPYIYWSIAEGGREFEFDMPAFKGRMPKKDIWALVAYIRARSPSSLALIRIPHCEHSSGRAHARVTANIRQDLRAATPGRPPISRPASPRPASRFAPRRCALARHSRTHRACGRLDLIRAGPGGRAAASV